MTTPDTAPVTRFDAPPVAASPPVGSVWVFFLATFVASWACYIPVAKAFPPSTALGQSILLLGVFAPSYVAIALTALRQGTPGVRALVGRVFQGKAAARWYVFAIGFTAALKLTAAVIHRVAYGAWPRFGATPWIIIPFAIALSTPVQAGEEIGWRGYALPRLASRMGLAPASLLLGVIWALWHLPLFFVRESDTFGQSFPMYTLQVMGFSVAIALLYAQSNGGLLLPMLLHAAANNSKDMVPSMRPGATNTFGLAASPIGWITVALLWTCVIVMLAWMVKTEPQRAGRYGNLAA